MGGGLKHFNKTELKLTREQAWRVLRFFWPETSVNPGALTDEDCMFAQAVLVEAIDGSYQMGFVEILFRSSYMKVLVTFGDIKEMVKYFCKSAAKHWFKHATGRDLTNPQIYEAVRRQLSLNFRTVWILREQTGELSLLKAPETASRALSFVTSRFGILGSFLGMR